MRELWDKKETFFKSGIMGVEGQGVYWLKYHA